MRHRIHISKADLHWNDAFKKLSLVEHNFAPFDSVFIGVVEIINGKISEKDLVAIGGLYDNNKWGIRSQDIYQFFSAYSNIIPAVNIFESADI